MSSDEEPFLAERYGVDDIRRWFDAATIRKAGDYGQLVDRLQIDEFGITAEVQGTDWKPYEVDIEFDRSTDGEIWIDAHCSCPVGSFCKHCAAVLIFALTRRPKAAAAAPRPAGVSPAVLAWVAEMETKWTPKAGGKKPAKKPAAKPVESLIHYVITRGNPHFQDKLVMLKGRVKEGVGVSAEIWQGVERSLKSPPQFADEDDLAVFQVLFRMRPSNHWDSFPLTGPHMAAALERVATSGRLWLAEVSGEYRYNFSPAYWHFTHLDAGRARVAQLGWQLREGDLLAPVLQTEPPYSVVLATTPLWYVDAGLVCAGPLDLQGQEAILLPLLQMPPLAAQDIPVVADLIGRMAPTLPRPDPGAQADALVTLAGPPQPLLRVDTLRPYGMASYRGYPAVPYGLAPFDCGKLRFIYGEGETAISVEPFQEPRYYPLVGGKTARIERDDKAEKARMLELSKQGFEFVPKHVFMGNLNQTVMGLESEAAWNDFTVRIAPALRAQGWRVEMTSDFRHNVLEPEQWEADLEDEGNGWFSLSMGIVVEGRRLALAPLLADLFKREPQWLNPAHLAKTDDAAGVILMLDNGQRIRVPAGRVKPFSNTLIDLFDRPDAEGRMRVSLLDAPRLAELAEQARWQFRGVDAVQDMARRLAASHGVQPVPPPPGFTLDLRPYQREGLAWLQYLREQGLGGILADDMGLGKTAQTLAHLLTEKQAGRLQKPVLAVLPTSLIFNWKREAERCAPELKVLSLHGKERYADFARIPAHDICLTTYPLLWRDEDDLAKHAYSTLILDEAQTVKNAHAKAAGVIRRLKSDHRLCLTGTPLENHLGELWSQFDFLLPGLLGDSKDFTKHWRTPIEKRGDVVRRDLLARRLAPFILRRKKAEVAQDLPDKTIIVRTVELEGGQRDLYETVRVAMDARVREEVAAKGFNRSQIVILDALLKLRQVCCDPRLLKTVRAAQKVKERAKLDLLMEMIPEMIDEGRRILVFSQFTSMLDLIAEALDKEKIGYLSLTGQTKNREQIVRGFQEGETPVFLISLKAGGVGLNLTAADTVIHFDPWWNPAVENQATDRAHRIGQTRNVFVYKLVVAGSIEERIVALQDKKAALAEGVLSEDAGALSKFSEADIQALLAPLPER